MIFGLIEKAFGICASTVQQVIGAGQNVFNKFFSEEAREARREKREAKKEKAAEKAAHKAAKKAAKEAARRGEDPDLSVAAAMLKDRYANCDVPVEMGSSEHPTFDESRYFQDESVRE